MPIRPENADHYPAKAVALLLAVLLLAGCALDQLIAPDDPEPAPEVLIVCWNSTLWLDGHEWETRTCYCNESPC